MNSHDIPLTISVRDTRGKCANPASKQSCKRYAMLMMWQGLLWGTFEEVESKEYPSGCYMTPSAVVWNEEKESDITPQIAICTIPPSSMNRFKKIRRPLFTPLAKITPT